MSENQGNNPEAVCDSSTQTVRFGQFSLDGNSDTLHFRGTTESLSRAATTVMRLTAAAAGSPVHPEALLSALGNSGLAYGPEQLWTCVTGLNQVLERISPGSGFIAHFPQDGYALIVPRHARCCSWAIPARSKSIIGREEIAATICAKLLQHRFVSIVGPGGIGKTTVAGLVAETSAGAFPDGVFFIDAASLADARLLPNVLAQALGVTVNAGAETAGLLAFLKDRQVLVVLDSCEHLIGAAADLAELLLRSAPKLAVLATTREALMASGEWLYRLGSIGLPPVADGVTAAQALQYPALQLFVDRARERFPDYVLDDASAAQACALCNRLDGIPLAIELAAARVGVLGIGELLEQVEYRLFSDTDRIDSTATTRHETLGAMLDWSYNLLPVHEQQTLLRLSIFRAEFTLTAAVSILAAEALEIAQGGASFVLELLSKSLLSYREDVTIGRYRMLDTTRTYAGAKLDALGIRSVLQARHARYLCGLMKTAEDDWLVMPRDQWLNTYRMWIDDIRAALDWALVDGGDALLGNELLIAAFPLGHQASLTAEFGARLAHAITLVPPSSMSATLLHIQQNLLLCNIKSPVDLDNSSIAIAAEAALNAEPDSPLYKYRALLAASLWTASFIPGDFPGALVRVEALRASAEAAGDWISDIISRRMHAQTLHFLGRHAESQVQAEFVLANAWRRIPLVGNGAQLDFRVSMRIMLARIACISGRTDQAAHLTSEALDYAANDTATAEAQVLSLSAIPIALWCGDNAAASALTQRLLEHASAYSLNIWIAWAEFYRDVVASLEGDKAASARLLTIGTSPLDNTRRDHIVTFNVDLLAPDSGARVLSGAVGWCAPELLRARGEYRIKQGDFAAGSALLHRALYMARAQAALTWELRAAISLASLWKQQDGSVAARGLLAPLLARFTDSHETVDIRRASVLLTSC